MGNEAHTAMARRRRVLGKIRACLTRAAGEPSPEADLAAQRARELMAKYRVAFVELYDDEVVIHEIVTAKRSPLVNLWVGAATVTGCLMVGAGDRVRVVGRGADVKRADGLVSAMTASIGRLADAALGGWGDVEMLRQRLYRGCKADKPTREEFVLGASAAAARKLLRAYGSASADQDVRDRATAYLSTSGGSGQQPKAMTAPGWSRKFGAVVANRLMPIPRLQQRQTPMHARYALGDGRTGPGRTGAVPDDDAAG